MFDRKPAAVVEQTTGTTVLRNATASRRRKGHLGKIASDLGLSIAALEGFVDGKPLPEPALQLLAREFFNAELVTETNQLRKLNKPLATPTGLITPNYDPASNVDYPGTPDMTAPSGYRPGPPPGKPVLKRPGWE